MVNNKQVSRQVTDAVSNSSVSVLAVVPTAAMGALLQTMSHSFGILFENTVFSSRQQNSLSLAAGNIAITQGYSIDDMVEVVATEKISQAYGSDKPAKNVNIFTGKKEESQDQA